MPDGKLVFFRQWPGGLGQQLVCVDCQSESSSEQAEFADAAVQTDGAGSATSRRERNQKGAHKQEGPAHKEGTATRDD